MSFCSDISAVIAACINPLHPDVYTIYENTRIELTAGMGVNRPFFRSMYPGTLIVNCPGYPTTIGFYFYERYSTLPSTDPIVAIHGFASDCSDPGSGLGACRWVKMETLTLQFGQGGIAQPDWVHFKHWKSNTDSVGFVRRTFGPPPP